MTLCVNPECKQPHNSDDAQFCLSCDSKLLLLERYRPIKIIGKGGFGCTFLAVDERKPSKPRCAIKQLNFTSKESDAVNKAIELFEQEAILLENLGSHLQIPSLLAYFERDNRLYIVQEFIQGVTLEQELLEQGVFSEAKIRQLLLNILPVLDFVHQQKVLHRDIKPPNIIIRESDNQPVLIDFGVAKVLQDESFIQQATALGTFHYAAPEQFKGSVFPASDLYSLGVTCIALLTGVNQVNKLYDGANLCWHWHGFLPKETIISDGLRDILDKMLQYLPKERYQSAQSVLEAISSLEVPELETQAVILPETVINPPKLLEEPTRLPQTQKSTSVTASINTVQTTSANQTNQTSQLGIYYIKLELLLESQKWKEADIETWKLLCMALGKSPATPIQSSEINLISCEVILNIDKLWINASQGRFGFSIQNQIFDSISKDYVMFCKHVEWPSYNSPSYHQSLKFNNQAPAGHLPSRIWAEGDKFWRHLNAIASKLAQCIL